MSQTNPNPLNYRNMGNIGLLSIIQEELKNYLDNLEKSKKERAGKKYLKHLFEQDSIEIKNVLIMLDNLKYYCLYHVKRVLTTYLNERVVESIDDDSGEHKFKLEKLIEAIRL